MQVSGRRAITASIKLSRVSETHDRSVNFSEPYAYALNLCSADL